MCGCNSFCDLCLRDICWTHLFRSKLKGTQFSVHHTDALLYSMKKL